MAKKPNVAKKPKENEREMPKDALSKAKQLKNRYYKEESKEEFLDIYWEKFDEIKKDPKYSEFSDSLIHKKTITKIKNEKKREKIGGTIDKYYKVVFGISKIRDLNENKRLNILQKWKDDPQETMDDGLIMTRKEVNPATGEEEPVPILDSDGEVIPRDNREFFKLSDGRNMKNTNYDHALQQLLRKTVIGVCINPKGISGVFIEELRDEQTTLEIPRHKLLKSSSKTINSKVETLSENMYIDKNTLEEVIESIQDDVENGVVSEEYFNMVSTYYNKLMNNSEFETNLFFLRGSKSSYFDEVKNEKDLDACKILLDIDGRLNINRLYKEYLYPFTSDCSNLLKYHNDKKFIITTNKEGKEIKDTNWDEFVSLQDVNLLQMNTEASMSGNLTMYIDDESLFNNEILHLEKAIDSIKLIVPSSIKTDFAQDSKVNLIGSPFQFTAKDEENKDIYEEAYDEEGNLLKDDNGDPIKVPVLDYPSIMVYGIYAIDEYKIPLETIDMTIEDGEIDEKEILAESDELTEEEIKDMEDAVEKNKKKETEEEVEEEEETEEEVEKDEINDDDLW